MQIFDFGPYRLDADERTLRRGNQVVPLTGKEFDTLLALVRRVGVTVDKHALVQEIWPDRHVAENNLTQQVRSLRKKLGKDASGLDYIRTIANQGYFLAGSTHASPQPEMPPPLPARPEEPVKRHESIDQATGGRSLWHRRTLLIAALIICVAIAGIAMMAKSLINQQPTRLSVAVLEFRMYPQSAAFEWMAGAVAEMIRTELAATRNLRLIPGEVVINMAADIKLPTLGSLSKLTLTQIKDRLDSDYVAVGTITRLTPASEIRLDVKVQDTRTGDIIASESVAGSEDSLFTLVVRCGSLIRNRLGGSDMPESQVQALRDALPANFEAAQLYVSGVARLRAFEPLVALRLLQSAADKDPRSAVIQSALAEAWKTLGYEEKAKAAAQKASALARRLPRENQLLIEGRYRELAGDKSQALEAYQALWKYFPDDLEHGLRLTRVLLNIGKQPEAIAVIAQMRRLPSAAVDPRIDLVEAEAAELRGDFNKEVEAAQRAIQNGNNKGNRLLVARAQLKMCWALNYKGQRDRAIQLAESAARTFAELGDKGGEAQAIKNLADVTDDDGNHAAAVPIYEKAVARFREIGNQTGIAVTLNNMGYAIKDLGDLEKAKVKFQQSIEICRGIGDLSREAQALNGLAGIFWRQGRHEDAQKAYEEALDRFRKTGEQNRLATILNNLALVLQDRGRLAEAHTRLQECLDILKSTGDESGKARTLGNLGELALKRGDLVAAKKHFDDAGAIGERIDDDKQRAYALHGLGKVAWERGDVARAKQLLDEALKLREKTQETGLQAETLLAMAVIDQTHPDGRALHKAKEIAARFQKEGQVDQQALAETLAIQCALRARPPNTKAAQASGSVLKELLPRLEDRAVKLSVMAALAHSKAAAGNVRGAAAELGSIIRGAAEDGYLVHVLESSLMLAKIERNPEEKARIVREVERKALITGLARIAAEASSLKSEKTH